MSRIPLNFGDFCQSCFRVLSSSIYSLCIWREFLASPEFSNLNITAFLPTKKNCNTFDHFLLLLLTLQMATNAGACELVALLQENGSPHSVAHLESHGHHEPQSSATYATDNCFIRVYLLPYRLIWRFRITDSIRGVGSQGHGSTKNGKRLHVDGVRLKLEFSMLGNFGKFIFGCLRSVCLSPQGEQRFLERIIPPQIFMPQLFGINKRREIGCALKFAQNVSHCWLFWTCLYNCLLSVARAHEL